VVSTGDELVEPGQYRDRADPELDATMLRRWRPHRSRSERPSDRGPDEPEPLRQALARGLAADVLIITAACPPDRDCPRDP